MRRPQKAGSERIGMAPDPLVRSGNPPHRRATGTAAHPTLSRRRLVALATGPSGRRSPSPSQTTDRRCKTGAAQKATQEEPSSCLFKNATVMLAVGGAVPCPRVTSFRGSAEGDARNIVPFMAALTIMPLARASAYVYARYKG